MVYIKTVGKLVTGVLSLDEKLCKILSILKSYFSGGGLYDNNGSFKNGKWIELSDSFYCYSQVTYQGEYKNCKKVGIWVILGKIQGVNQEKGGGEYDDQLDCVNSLRNGLWIELSDEFDELSQIIYKGEYKHGKKIGVWDEINFKKNEKCGQLNYEN
ncbi:unnamed protein product [Paramecium octaurelia]|uniref:Uncharacterized protein n=1 Tax=Paramecium octaurelia TaxID=43137 RepID=A0A8S1Y1S5_PAROT|nr:unnamed protein product [Paramecium octaurelia]